MTVFPPAPLLWQNNLALDYTHSQIAYVGYEGTIFHISGPFAPVLGAQAGVVLQKIAHLDPGFKHLDNKGARQDGTTWYDTLYDPAEITMVIKIGGMSASDLRHTVAAWFGAWDARQVGQLCWFSPERGEWVANVRLAKPVLDTFEHDWYESQEVTMTWVARVDQAFWQGPDSICQFTNNNSFMFDTFPWAGTLALDSNWTTQTIAGTGTINTAPTGGANFTSTSNATDNVLAEWTGHNAFVTDDQFITVTLPTGLTAPSNAVYTVTDTGSTGGTFTLTWNTHTTSGIGWNAANNAVASALNALTGSGGNGFAVTGGPGPGTAYTVTFQNGLAGVAQTLTGSGAGLTGGSLVVTSVGTGGVAAYVDIWGRMNQTGTPGQYGTRLRISYNTYELDVFSGGTQHTLITGPIPTPLQAGTVISLQCGVMNASLVQDLGTILSGSLVTGLHDIFQLFTGQSNGSGVWNPHQYQFYINGVPVLGGTQVLFNLLTVYWGTGFGLTDNNHYASIGSGYRSAGFGFQSGWTGQSVVLPQGIGQFNAGAATGDISLTNIGDQPAWPRYLCYGPGFFMIQDVGTNNFIAFGPLLPGQIALLNTMPRLPAVVDLSPAQNSATAPPNGLLATLQFEGQQFLQTLINFATNNNVPPLLQEFESLFGIAPPQGPLASYLQGKFTQPVPAMREQVGATTTNIKCHIQGGNDQTKIVAALTPFRRWPE